MCGRARLSSDVSEIKLVFSIPPQKPTPNIAPSWNVAPTDPLPVVRYDPRAGERSLDVMRWSLVPFWAKDIKVVFANIDAKAKGIVYLRAFSSSAGAKAMIETRISKVIMVASLALFALLVTFDNLTDYETNYAFVRHVLSMDTTFPGNGLLYRRITSPVLWQAGYALIIVGEGLSGIVLAVAAISLARRLRSDGARFNHAKRFVIIGAALGFLEWFFGFMVVGGEWFSMWQSPTWNGQEAAFRFYMTILAVLIFVNQPDGELSASSRQPAMRQRE
jgi:predicted small integral membrane protein